jgi:hypothetical protein
MAHFALQRLHILPHVIQGLPRTERAFVYASCVLRAEAEDKETERIKKIT